MLRHFSRGDTAFIFCRAQLHAGDQPAEILISLPCFDEQRIAKSTSRCNFRADVRPNFVFHRGVVKARRSIKAVAIEQRHCRKLDLRGARRQSFGKGSAFEEAESRASVEFDVHQSYTPRTNHSPLARSRTIRKTPRARVLSAFCAVCENAVRENAFVSFAAGTGNSISRSHSS